MNPDQVADVVTDLLAAQVTHRHFTVLRILGQIVTGERGNSLHVALTLAGTVAKDQTLKPGQDFHQLTVAVTEPDGTTHPGTADDLRPPVRIFCQMVVALANEDARLARDLFIGFVDSSARNASQVLAVGVGMAARHVCVCPPDNPPRQEN